MNIKNLAIALLLIGCQSSHPITISSPKTVAQVQSNVEFIVSSNTKSQKHDYLVRLNFVLLKKEKDANPDIVAAFRDSLIEWAAYLPIEIMITVDETSFPIDLLSPRAMTGGILVRITDIQAVPIGMDENVLGAYDGTHNVLYLDEGKTRDLSYLISLHEIGHALGLAHVMPTEAPLATAGTVIVSEGFDKNIMIPALNIYRGNGHPTLLEVKLAREYIRTLATPFAFTLKDNQCHLR